TEAILSENYLQRIKCFREIVADENTLAERQTINLYDSRPFVLADKIHGIIVRTCDEVFGGGNVVPDHKVFCKCLACLKLCTRFFRTEYPQSSFLEMIYYSISQGIVGADDDQINFVILCKFFNAGKIGDFKSDVLRFFKRGSAAVS